MTTGEPKPDTVSPDTYTYTDQAHRLEVEALRLGREILKGADHQGPDEETSTVD